MRLETKRLILRRPDHGDAEAYAEIFGDPEVMRFLGGTKLEPEQIAGAIDRMLGQWERNGVGLFSVVRKEDEVLLGRVGYLLWDTERWVSAMHEPMDGDDLEMEIGWTMARAFWGQGYATEAAIACRDHAFEELGRDRVISLIAPDNIASIRVAEKIGETIERTGISLGATIVDIYSVGKRPAR